MLNSSGQYGTDQNCFSQLQDIFDSIHSLSLIQQIGNIIVTKILADKVTSASVSFAEISKFCQDFYQCKKTTDAQKLLIDLLNKTFLPHNGDEQGCKHCVSKERQGTLREPWGYKDMNEEL